MSGIVAITSVDRQSPGVIADRTDRVRTSIATVALIVMVLAPWSAFQIGTIVVGGLAGWFLCRGDADTAPDSIAMPMSRKAGIACLAVFFVLLAGSVSFRACSEQQVPGLR